MQKKTPPASDLGAALARIYADILSWEPEPAEEKESEQRQVADKTPQDSADE